MTAAALPAAPATPGAYLRRARLARGVTIPAIARMTVSSPVDLDAAIAALEGAEADRELLGDADLARLAPALGVDPAVYLRLSRDEAA